LHFLAVSNDVSHNIANFLISILYLVCFVYQHICNDVAAAAAAVVVIVVVVLTVVTNARLGCGEPSFQVRKIRK